MPQWTKDANGTEDVTILLFPRFSNHCLANTVEPLRAANELLDRDAYRWRFVTPDGAAVTSSSGLPVLPEGALADHPGGDTLFVVASYDAPALATPATKRALRAAAKRFRVLAGLDTGSWLLAHAGLLDGHRATIHPAELTAFSEAFDTIDAVTDRFVRDGDRITCGGAMTAFDLVLDMLRRRHGEALRLDVAAFFLEPSVRPAPLLLTHQVTSPLLASTLATMFAEIETPVAIPALANRLGVSDRTLARAFLAEFGAPPAAVYRRLRLSVARDYARAGRMPVSEIAVRCGYRNAAAMTRAFTREFGIPPTAFRTTPK
ncbi:MAG: GlxA family transcriptional regulator [Pseudomonadota bacterium]